ncbi:MAG TPA: CRISPR-associated ring nuclease Csm6 [Pyrinomonadaceae bacterium]|jgi:CRISPR-associated protein (TIGR02584 family)
MERRKHILLCVAGGTPQIITETLWAVMQRGERVDEIRVITTLEGRQKVRQLLLDEKEGKFHQFRRDFPETEGIKFNENSLYLLTKRGVGMPSPRDSDEDRLEDLLTDEDNDRAADQICEIVRELTRDQGQRIHASVAGGRKTMGIYLTAAMQLFGRFDDALSHVLVSPEVENNPKFFYKPPAPEILFDRNSAPLKTVDGRDYTTDDAEIYLADIPFIRLRAVGSKMFSEAVSSYGEMVEETQENLKFLESSFNLRFDMRGRKVIVGTREITLPERLFFVYVLFAYLRKHRRGVDGFVALDEIERADLDAVCRLISSARGREDGFEMFAARSSRGYLYTLDVESVVRELPEKDRTVTVARDEIRRVMREILGKILHELETAKLPEEYLINRRGKKFEYSFGLPVSPDRIMLP